MKGFGIPWNRQGIFANERSDHMGDHKYQAKNLYRALLEDQSIKAQRKFATKTCGQNLLSKLKITVKFQYIR